jgi:hypothetical protein
MQLVHWNMFCALRTYLTATERRQATGGSGPLILFPPTTNGIYTY